MSCTPRTLLTKNRPPWTILLLAVALAAPLVAQQPLTELYRQDTKLEQPNTIAAGNLFDTARPEIVATDVRGHIKVFDSLTGEEFKALSRTVDGNVALTGPVLGDFLGRNTLDIAVGTTDGRVIYFDGSTLDVIAEAKISDRSFALLPTVTLMPPQDDPARQREGLVMIDEGGLIHGVVVTDDRNVEDYWEPINSGSRGAAPASVGTVRQPVANDIVFPTSDNNVIIIDPRMGTHEKIYVRETQSIMTTPLLIDINQDGHDDMVLTFDNGDIWALRYTDRNKLEKLWEYFSNNPPVGEPTLVGTIGVPLSQQLIFYPGRTLEAINPVTGLRKTEGDTKSFGGINTPLALIPSEMGYPSVAMGIGQVVRVVDTETWFTQAAPALRYPEVSVGDRLNGTPLVVTVEDDQGEFTKMLVIGMTESGRLVGIPTPETPLELTTTPWMTRGGSSRHNPRFDQEYFQRHFSREIALEELHQKTLDDLDAAMQAGNYDDALVSAEWLAEFNPANSEYQSKHREIWIRRNMIMLALAGLLALAVVGLVAYFVIGFLLVRRLERRARAAVTKAKWDEAMVMYERLRTKKPKNPKIIATLALVYTSRSNYEPKTIEVYQKALAQDPDNKNLLHAYARALLKDHRYTKEAHDVYEKALKSFSEPPLLEYALGLCLKNEGKLEQAGKRLRAALRGGLAKDEVYAALCDVYLEMGVHSAKALPVYKQQFNNRQEDARFLQAYLQSCMDAKQTDSQVETLCHMVLDLDPKFVPAYCHLAAIYLQKNEIGRAIEEVNRANEVDPTSEQAIALLAHCYMLQARSDEQALAAFRKALKMNPNDSEMLRMVAEIYQNEGRYDAEAVDIYHRSHEENPDDAPTLKALAETARLTNNHDLAIRSIEALIHQGQGNPELNAQLAYAYIAEGIYETRAERIYREALKAKPDDTKLLGALARVLMSENRDDPEAIPIYERHLHAQRDDKEIGTQLVRAYNRNNRYDDALKLAQYLLKKAPNDEELNRLVALSSLHGNKIEEAVAEYQNILKRNPNDKEAQVHLALAYAQKGKYDEEAGGVIRQALAVQPENAELHLAMARICVEGKDAPKAVEHYQHALKARPGSEDQLIRHINAVLAAHPEAARVRWFLCEVLVAYGHFRDALDQLATIYESNPNHVKNILKALDKILAKDPKNVAALVQKGRMLIATNDTKSARATLEQAYQLQPGSPDVTRVLCEVYEAALKANEDMEVRFKLGRIYFSSQEYDKAIGCFQKTAQDYRWEAESTKMLGKCFTAKGMLDLALQEYKKLVVDDETKELLYDLAQRYEAKKDLVGAKTVYRQLFAADIDYKDVKTRFEMLSGSTSDPMAFEKTSIVQQMSEDAKRRYELLDELGRGAMGIVYRARDKELEEVVALKILPDSMSNNPEAVHRFKVEARNARKLSHPNIVRIHDIGEEMGRKYISMEYVDGSDLKKRIKSGKKMEPKEIYHYAIQIADALAYAHRLGIVHRDIKPANIMLTTADEIKVTDFGIAKMLDSTGEGTMVGAVIGTPLYMSPEQVQGIPVDNRADIYSYGVMLYEFVNSKPPFIEGDLAYQHMHRDPDRPENCSDELWAIIAKCLAKDKDDRWANADEIVEALRDARKASSAV